MNRIPGIIPNLRCPRPHCRGNIEWRYDEVFGWERLCMFCSRVYKEPEKQEVNDGS